MSADRPTYHLAAIQAVGRVVSLVLQLLHFAVLARAYGPDRFGAFAAGLAVASVAGVAGDFGIPTTLLVARATADRATIWATGLRAVLATSAVAVTGGVVFALVVLDGDARLAACILLLWAGIGRVRLVATAVCQADYEAGRVVAADVGFRLVALLGAVAAAVATSSFAVLSAVVAVGLVAGEVVGLALVWPGRPAAADRRAVRALIVRSRDFGLTAATASVHSRVDQVLLSAYRVAQGGPYAVAYRLVDAALAVMTVVSSLIVPVLGRCNGPDRERLARAVTAAAVLFGMASAGVIYMGAAVLVDIVGGAGYGDAVPIVRVLAIVLLIAVVNVPLLHLVMVEGGSNQLLRISIVMVVVNLSLNAVLIPSRGASGAAVATLVSEAVGLTLVARLARRYHPGVLPTWRPWRDLRPLRDRPSTLASIERVS